MKKLIVIFLASCIPVFRTTKVENKTPACDVNSCQQFCEIMAVNNCEIIGPRASCEDNCLLGYRYLRCI